MRLQRNCLITTLEAIQNWITMFCQYTLQIFLLNKLRETLSIRHMPECLYSSRKETKTMINLSIVCANDSRIKWLDFDRF